MVLLVHIIIAISSVLYTTLLAVRPTERKFASNYALIIATLLSGSYLVLRTHANMQHACISGIVYLGIVLTGTLLAHKRLRA